MELSIIRAIQSISNDFFDVLFQIITMLGEESLVLLAVLAVYFVVDKKAGGQLVFVLFTSLLVNISLKDFLQFQRPIGQPGIRSLRLETAGGYSFPSGHTQTSSTLAFFLAKWKGGKKAYLLALAVGLLVAVSRLYLGVHYPKDVLVGLLLGVVLAVGLSNLLQILNRPNLLYGLVLLIFLPGVVLNGSPDYLHSYGLFCGFLLASYLENRFVGFDNQGPLPKRLLRWFLAIFVVAAVLALCHFLPAWPLFDFLSYFVLALAVLFLYPWGFTKLGL